MDIVQAVAGLIMFIVMGIIGLELTLGDFRQLLRFPFSVALGVLGQLILLPAIACILILSMDLNASTIAALLIVAACPGGGLTNILTAKAQGNIALSICLTALYGLVSLVSIPLILFFGFEWFLDQNHKIEVPAAIMIGQLFVLVIVPVSLGMLVREFRASFVLRNTRVFNAITNISLAVLVSFSIFADNGMSWMDVKVSILPAGIFSVAILLSGFLLGKLGGLNRADHIALSIEFIIRNNAISMLIVLAILQRPDLLGFVTASIMFQLPLGLASALFYRMAYQPRPAPASN